MGRFDDVIALSMPQTPRQYWLLAHMAGTAIPARLSEVIGGWDLPFVTQEGVEGVIATLSMAPALTLPASQGRDESTWLADAEPCG
jgi:hypothetical protein